ncbi:oligopeptide transporter protein [Endogone sp. FLAS-F59071]|nr:oligopeptide transporter protein [Endogone sp. FLAS-F59071]|eukprot:RUS22850.1 oligopeptide transporter protein [Endogone sp. FLAS-F59071]
MDVAIERTLLKINSPFTFDASLFLRSLIMAAFISAHEFTEEHARADEAVTNETLASDIADADGKSHKVYLNGFNEKFKEPSSEEPTIDENPEEFEGIPLVVREIVSFKDDPTELTLTFRFFLLSTVFSALGAFITQLSWFRTTSAPFSIFFVQVVSHWIGQWLAVILPDREWNLLGWKFNLVSLLQVHPKSFSPTIELTKMYFQNPGPFSLKEHVLIVLAVSSGSQNNLGEIAIATADIFYKQMYEPVAAIVFMICAILLSYSLAVIPRSFLIHAPEFIWPQALMQTQLFHTLRQDTNDKKTSSKQLRVFLFVAAGIYFWEFLPEYVFPFLSSLAILCWFAPHNPTVKFVGSGLGGMGFLNFTLDWSNVTSSITLMPWWTQVITFVAFVVSMWILAPIVYFNKLWNADKIPIFSQSLCLLDHIPADEFQKVFLQNGTTYPVLKLITPENTFNETAYAEYGPPIVSSYFMWTIFFSYASYVSAIISIMLFAGPKLIGTAREFINKEKKPYKDLLNKLQSAYPEVPYWWWGALFLVSFVSILFCILFGGLYMPWWTFVIAVVVAAIIVTPMAYIYAISNYQVQVGVFNELVFGYMAPGLHPLASLFYRVIAAETWYRAQTILQDMKLGHYCHIPPRAVFFSQVFAKYIYCISGTFIGAPIEYAVIRWVVDTKRPYLDGTLSDPLGQYTGQSAKSYYNTSIQYGLVGPARLFASAIYSPLLWGFLVGAVAPAIIYALHRTFPKARFDLWNTTIFFGAMSTWYGNISTGPLSSFIGGFICQFYFFRYRHETWRKYNYLIGAALDTGFNLAVLSIFIFFSSARQIKMPSWWGNDPVSVEKCYGS